MEHRSRVQAQIQKESKARSKLKDTGHKHPMTDEELWARLDDLEIIESQGREIEM